MFIFYILLCKLLALLENIFKFKEDIVAAIKDSQVKKADEVKTLLKYLKGEARARVGEH